MSRILTLLLAGGLALALVQPALAGPKHQNKGKHGGPSVERDADDKLTHSVITAAETNIIHDFIRRQGVQAFGPPQGLPPGIAKNLARGKPLPPGIAKRYLPQGLLGQLPRRQGYELIVADRDILLVNEATRIIVDVLKGVL